MACEVLMFELAFYIFFGSPFSFPLSVFQQIVYICQPLKMSFFFLYIKLDCSLGILLRLVGRLNLSDGIVEKYPKISEHTDLIKNVSVRFKTFWWSVFYKMHEFSSLPPRNGKTWYNWRKSWYLKYLAQSPPSEIYSQPVFHDQSNYAAAHSDIVYKYLQGKAKTLKIQCLLREFVRTSLRSTFNSHQAHPDFKWQLCNAHRLPSILNRSNGKI